ncbi:methyltransferase family protein [Acinetobacter calcoaceticus]|uniref:Methyltransferase family protein n=1 Tax=Acinetobacter calcoaceticus TaxID=471 RepID=A0A4R1XK73_ACICA|nr:methyltransferase family protein [Acinetobacter calcoaceticus]
MLPAASLSLQEQQFLTAVEQAIASHALQRLIFSQYQGELQHLEKISLRLMQGQEQVLLNCVYKYKTQDVTQNYALDQAMTEIQTLLSQCKQANLLTTTEELQLKKTKKKVMLARSKTAATAQAKHAAEALTASQATQDLAAVNTLQSHDREKKRLLDQSSPYLQHLGICDPQAQLIPSMARKWKQINKFVEIFSNALGQIEQPERDLQVVDFGSGKGYLTFALYDYLLKQQQTPQVTGVELNPNMVQFCQDVAAKSQFEQLAFFQGDVRSYQPEHTDVMIALHACDIATDFAIHTGIRLNASIIMCAPCCHKELRPQMQSPALLKPMLQFGIHAGQQAEMLTDTIRALLLKAYGYDTKVFEFVALEHTSKNKMILATKRKHYTSPDAEVLAQIQALKQHYAIEKHSLELLLNDQWQQHDLGKKC